MGENEETFRVLITTSTLPVIEGDGQARFVLDLARALSAHAAVTVLAPHAPGATFKEIIESVRIRRFRYFLPLRSQRLAYGPGMRHNIERSWLAKIQMPFFVFAQVLATGWVAVRGRASVINAHWLVPQGFTTALISRVLRIPMVLHVHAADVYFLRGRRYGRWVARFVVRSSSIVFADGSHVRDSLDYLIGYESGARLRPMGVWTTQFDSNVAGQNHHEHLPEHFVLFVGRLVEKKGVEYLIRAMVKVRRLLTEMELVIVGSGPLEDELRSLAVGLGIADSTHFMGPRAHEQVAATMRLADVVCVPSIIDSKGETEGMPTVVIEGMASGSRVVGTQVDGIPDILEDAQNGWLVRPADSEHLAQGILAALRHPHGDAIAAAGSRTARDHDWLAVADEYGSALVEAADD